MNLRMCVRASFSRFLWVYIYHKTDLSEIFAAHADVDPFKLAAPHINDVSAAIG